MGPVIRHLLLLLVAVVLVFPMALAREDPNSKKVRVLYLGDDRGTLQIQLALGWIMAEPKFELVVVPADSYFILLSEALKRTRLYLPRNYAKLNSTTDVIVLNNISPWVMDIRMPNFFQRGILEEGMGLALVSLFYWGGTNDMEQWVSMPFYDVFPADVDLSRQFWGYEGKIFIEVVKRKPIMDLPGIEEVPMEHTLNHGTDIFPRPGSVVHSIWKGHRTPVLVTGEYGQGATLQLSTAWHIIPREGMSTYPYMPDYIYNQLYFVAGVSPPEDIALARRAREMFIYLRTRRIVTLSTLEFADKFGARVGEIEEELYDMQSEVYEAESSYLSGDYELAATALETLMEAFTGIEARVVESRRSAMLWIHLTEWLAVTAVSLICSFVIWSLMVRKRLYQEVEATRLRLRTE
jgi:hypothetical protein